MSHRKFWQSVVDLNLSSAIVFEDDIHLVDDFKPKLMQNIQRLHQDNITYDVLLLGAIGKVNYFGRDGIGLRLFSGYIGGSKKLKRLGDYIYIPSRPAGTHAYMISNQGEYVAEVLVFIIMFHIFVNRCKKIIEIMSQSGISCRSCRLVFKSKHYLSFSFIIDYSIILM